MSVTSYATLLTEVATRARPGGASSELTDAIPNLVADAENRIAREVRAHEMETTYSGSITSGVIAVPTDFIGWKVVYIDGSSAQILQVKSLDWIYKNYPTRSSDGKPKFIARNASNFEFGPYPDSTYTVKGTFYQRPTAVATSWNSLATEYPDLYLYATLAEVGPFIRDANMIGLWESKYQQVKEFINSQAREIEFSGAPLAVTAG